METDVMEKAVAEAWIQKNKMEDSKMVGACEWMIVIVV